MDEKFLLDFKEYSDLINYREKYSLLKKKYEDLVNSKQSTERDQASEKSVNEDSSKINQEGFGGCMDDACEGASKELNINQSNLDQVVERLVRKILNKTDLAQPKNSTAAEKISVGQPLDPIDLYVLPALSKTLEKRGGRRLVESLKQNPDFSVDSNTGEVILYNKLIPESNILKLIRLRLGGKGSKKPLDLRNLFPF